MLTSIPMAEADALAQAPVKWTIHLAGHDVRMCVPLFSYTQYRYFKRFSRLVSARDASDAELPLTIWLKCIQGDDEDAQQAREALADALDYYRDTHGCTPDSLNDLLAMLSDPADYEQFWTAVEAWSADVGIVMQRPEAPDADITRDAIRTVIGHAMPVSDMLLLVENLDKVNIEVKKKFKVAKQAKDEKSHSKNLSSVLQRIRSGEIQASP